MVSQFNLLQNVPHAQVLSDYFLTDGRRKQQLSTIIRYCHTSRVNVNHVWSYVPSGWDELTSRISGPISHFYDHVNLF